jgi:hypothetical protein
MHIHKKADTHKISDFISQILATRHREGENEVENLIPLNSRNLGRLVKLAWFDSTVPLKKLLPGARPVCSAASGCRRGGQHG